MNIKEINRGRKEIIVDDVPVGYMILNKDSKIEHLEIYDSFLMSEYEFKILLEFIDKVIEYIWVDSE